VCALRWIRGVFSSLPAKWINWSQSTKSKSVVHRILCPVWCVYCRVPLSDNWLFLARKKTSHEAWTPLCKSRSVSPLWFRSFCSLGKQRTLLVPFIAFLPVKELWPFDMKLFFSGWLAVVRYWSIRNVSLTFFFLSWKRKEIFQNLTLLNWHATHSSPFRGFQKATHPYALKAFWNAHSPPLQLSKNQGPPAVSKVRYQRRNGNRLLFFFWNLTLSTSLGNVE